MLSPASTLPREIPLLPKRCRVPRSLPASPPDRLALQTPTLFPRAAILALRGSAQMLFPSALGPAKTAAHQARACPAHTSTVHAAIRAAFRIPESLPPSAT